MSWNTGHYLYLLGIHGIEMVNVRFVSDTKIKHMIFPDHHGTWL